MRYAPPLVCLVVVLLAHLASGYLNDETFNVESVLNNPRVLNAYLKCVLGTGSCTKEGRQIKRLMPEVVKTACNTCDPKVKANLRTFLRRVQSDPRLSDMWRKVLEKYDPKRIYRAGLDRFVNGN